MNYRDAMWHLRWAGARGDSESQYNLGLMYAKGRGVPENDAEAVKWFSLAAEQGFAIAQYSLGMMIALGWGHPEDYIEGVKWCRLAADQGDTYAQNILDLLYLNCTGEMTS